MGIWPAGVWHEETVVSRRGGGGDKKSHFDQKIFQRDSTKTCIYPFVQKFILNIVLSITEFSEIVDLKRE